MRVSMWRNFPCVPFGAVKDFFDVQDFGKKLAFSVQPEGWDF